MVPNLFKMISKLKLNHVVFEKKAKYNFRNTNPWHVAQWVSRDTSDAPPPSANLKKSDYSCVGIILSNSWLLSAAQARENAESLAQSEAVARAAEEERVQELTTLRQQLEALLEQEKQAKNDEEIVRYGGMSNHYVSYK